MSEEQIDLQCKVTRNNRREESQWSRSSLYSNVGSSIWAILGCNEA